jgi:hypothetical protein
MIYSTPGNFTWIAPSNGVVRVQIWGAGGGGGGSGLIKSGSGGGGGAYTESIINVTKGMTYNIVVGAGGAGGIASVAGPTKGSNGEASSFSTIVSKGGGGGKINAGGNGGNNPVAAGTISFDGGDGADSIVSLSGGGGGSSAAPSSNGHAATSSLGAIGPAESGNGGSGGTILVNANLSAGAEPGGGGGGAGNVSVIGHAGARGGHGRVILIFSASLTISHTLSFSQVLGTFVAKVRRILQPIAFRQVATQKSSKPRFVLQKLPITQNLSCRSLKIRLATNVINLRQWNVGNLTRLRGDRQIFYMTQIASVSVIKSRHVQQVLTMRQEIHKNYVHSLIICQNLELLQQVEMPSKRRKRSELTLICSLKMLKWI